MFTGSNCPVHLAEVQRVTRTASISPSGPGTSPAESPRGTACTAMPANGACCSRVAGDRSKQGADSADGDGWAVEGRAGWEERY